MSGRRADPRTTVKYARVIEMIDLIEQRGPLTLDQLLRYMGIDHPTFKGARYSLPGRLAMQDRGVIIPRPVPQDGYVYKLAESYRTGISSEDGEANLQSALSDLSHRQATIWDDLNRLIDSLDSRRAITKRLRKLRSAITGVLERVDDIADPRKMDGVVVMVDEWVNHVLIQAGIRDDDAA